MNKIFQPGTPLYRNLSLLALVAVTVLLVIPGDAFPEDKLFARIFLDKIIHICIIGAMMFCFYMWANNRRYAMILFFSGIAYGVGMEFVQKYFCYHRAFEYSDMLADGAGCLIAYLVAIRFIPRAKK